MDGKGVPETLFQEYGMFISAVMSEYRFNTS